jgi:hypothetical protein
MIVNGCRTVGKKNMKEKGKIVARGMKTPPPMV